MTQEPRTYSFSRLSSWDTCKHAWKRNYIEGDRGECENDEVTVTCEKSNEQMPFLGGYNVFGINPDDLIEAQ